MDVVQGDIWLLELPDQKPRPALVVTRGHALGVLHGLTVARVTTTLRRGPTQVPLGPHEGLDRECVANFDDLVVVPRSALTVWVGHLGARRAELCAALSALGDC